VSASFPAVGATQVALIVAPRCPAEAAPIKRGASANILENVFRFAHQLDRKELWLFDRYQGSWRYMFGLPMVTPDDGLDADR